MSEQALDPRHAILFEPVQIGPKVARNRFYQAPHCTGMGEMPGASAYLRGTKAEGGWAVVMTEAVKIGWESDISAMRVMSRLLDELDVRNWRLMCEKVHEHGSLAGIQLVWGGSGVTGLDSRLASGGVSGFCMPHAYAGSFYELDREDIRRVQQTYVEAARLARQAGFDIVQIYGAQGAGLPLEFLSPWYNRRSDEYGGSLENRARFWLETLELVREAVGEELAVTARFNPARGNGISAAEGLDPEGLAFVEMADHLVDLWDIQLVGQGRASATDPPPARYAQENYAGEWLREVRKHTSKPIAAVGWFTTADMMADVIRSGQQDLIAAARPSISDPFLPTKIEQGRLDEIRECIACNICISRYRRGSRIVCTQNPTMGEEYRRGWHPERVPPVRHPDRSVLVIGAGPAGMETAITLGKRGFEHVHLVEASDEIGGHFRWVPRLPGLGPWRRVVEYRQLQLQKLQNVTVITRSALDAAGVLDYGANLIVCATGARWASDGRNSFTRGPIPGADTSLPWQLTPEQLMDESKAVPGEQVLLYDCDGYFIGPGLAEKLAREGRRVVYVTPFASVGPYLAFTDEAQVISQLEDLGVQLLPAHSVTKIEPGVVHGFDNSVPKAPLEWQVDAVVLVTQRRPNDALYRELKAQPAALEREAISGVFRTGDATAPRFHVADAIFDGHRLAREIENADPNIALPYIREHRVLNSTDADFTRLIRPDPRLL